MRENDWWLNTCLFWPLFGGFGSTELCTWSPGNLNPTACSCAHSITHHFLAFFLTHQPPHIFIVWTVIPTQINCLYQNSKLSLFFWWGPRPRKEIGSYLNENIQSKRSEGQWQHNYALCSVFVSLSQHIYGPLSYIWIMLNHCTQFY